jgi:hypothetical protein
MDHVVKCFNGGSVVVVAILPPLLLLPFLLLFSFSSRFLFDIFYNGMGFMFLVSKQVSILFVQRLLISFTTTTTIVTAAVITTIASTTIK